MFARFTAAGSMRKWPVVRGPQHLRVLLSDDHPIVRRGARTILECNREYEVCGEAGNGRETVEMAIQLHPDVVITDISMSPTNGLEATQLLLQSVPGIKVLILTMHDSVEMLRAAALAGASGYLLKSDAARYAVLAVEALAAHKLSGVQRVVIASSR